MKYFVLIMIIMFESVAYAIDITTIEINMVPIGKMASIVITALAGMWGIRKVIKLINRS